MSQEEKNSPVFDGFGYEPSLHIREMFVPRVTDYKPITYDHANLDSHKKIFVLCTEEKYMTMQNGLKFSTGNNIIETILPLLHLTAAGFEFEVYTPTGKPAVLENWSLPKDDQHVLDALEKYKAKFDHPNSLAEFIEKDFQSEAHYVALFIPGGHGAMLGLPDNKDVEKLIQWTLERDIFIFALCHGPAALIAAGIDKQKEQFPFAGYQIVSFPDQMDKGLDETGYLPGKMPWLYGEKLTELGIEILNTEITGACHTDRKLITGDSPLAANKFGELIAKALL